MPTTQVKEITFAELGIVFLNFKRFGYWKSY